MRKEIGSSFELSDKIDLENIDVNINNEYFDLKGKDFVLLSSGRTAISLILKTILSTNYKGKKIAFVPSFTCDSVIEPFIDNNFKVETYCIDDNLDINFIKFKEKFIKVNPDLVLIHSYFGFNTSRNINKIIDFLKDKQVVVIEDVTQNLYSESTWVSSDYKIASLRKWLPLTNGAFAFSKNKKFDYKIASYNKKLDKVKLEASIEKYKYLNNDKGDKEKYLKLFLEAEDILNNDKLIRSMSPISKYIQYTSDINELRNKRIENYNYLNNNIINIIEIKKLTPLATKSEIPLYFAMLVEDRNGLQNYLRQNNVYAPIIWPFPKIKIDICETTKRLYNNILCIPCDQRYDLEDMERILGLIKEFYK